MALFMASPDSLEICCALCIGKGTAELAGYDERIIILSNSAKSHSGMRGRDVGTLP